MDVIFLANVHMLGDPTWIGEYMPIILVLETAYRDIYRSLLTSFEWCSVWINVFCLWFSFLTELFNKYDRVKTIWWFLYHKKKVDKKFTQNHMQSMTKRRVRISIERHHWLYSDHVTMRRIRLSFTQNNVYEFNIR